MDFNIDISNSNIIYDVNANDLNANDLNTNDVNTNEVNTNDVNTNEVNTNGSNNMRSNMVDLKKLNNLNHITLEYFSNIGLYNKITNKNDHENYSSKSDKKFYKKRIINETKKMLKDDFQSDIVREIFNKYIFSLINHFKLSDRNELLQKEFLDTSNNILLYSYTNKDISNNVKMIESKDISTNYINDNERNEQCDEDNIDTKDSSNCNPNEILFKQKDCKILTMDNFITKKSKQKEKINYPLKKNINLREPDLKMKGIQKKEKKENLDNV